MEPHAETLDIGDVPELLRLAEDVHRSHQPRILRHDSEDLAMVVPLGENSPGKGTARSRADHEAFLSAAGGWKDVDTDKLIEDIYEGRRRSTKPPVEL